MPIKGVLFDKDGTLIDYQMSWGPINRAAVTLAAAGDAALAARLYACGGMDATSGITAANSLLAVANTVEIAEAFVAAGSPFDVTELTRKFDAIFTQSAAHAVPVTDLGALFTDLSARGYRLGIASSDSEAAINRLFEHLGIDRPEFIAGYDSGHGYKPGPGMVRGFCAATGLAPHEVAVVGDNPHDMEMALSAGAGLRIAVLTGTGTEDCLQPISDVCLPDISHLADYLTGR